MEKSTTRQRQRLARMGGRARAARHTPEDLRSFAENAGRRPWKLTPARERRILQLLESGWTYPRVAEKFGISLRTVGRIVRRDFLQKSDTARTQKVNSPDDTR